MTATASPILREVASIDLPTVLALSGEKPNAIRLARERLAEAEAAVGTAAGGFLPTLQVGGEYDRHSGRIEDAQGRFFDATNPGLLLGMTGQLALNPVRAYEGLSAAQARRDQSGASLEATLQATIYEAAAGYFDLVAAQAAIAIARDQSAAARAFREVAAARERQKVGLRLDRLQAEAEVARARQAETAATERFRDASTRLATLLRLDATVTLVSAETMVRPITFVAPEAALEPLVASALDGRPDVRAAALDIAAARADADAAGIGAFTPSLVGGVGRPPGGIGAFGPNFGDLRGREDWYVGVEWQLTGLGLGEIAASRAADARLKAALVRADDVRERAIAEVIQAREAIQARRDDVGAAEEELRAAEEARTIAQQRLALGTGLAVDVLTAEEARTRAATHLVDAVVGFDKAQYLMLERLGERPPPER
jgi:outer membrane protein TolC